MKDDIIEAVSIPEHARKGEDDEHILNETFVPSNSKAFAYFLKCVLWLLEPQTRL